MAIHNELGRWGEDYAADFLAAQGYRIVERNWRFGHHDIDIIASKGNEIVFVEVKTRHGSNGYTGGAHCCFVRQFSDCTDITYEC